MKGCKTSLIRMNFQQYPDQKPTMTKKKQKTAKHYDRNHFMNDHLFSCLTLCDNLCFIRAPLSQCQCEISPIRRFQISFACKPVLSIRQRYFAYNIHETQIIQFIPSTTTSMKQTFFAVRHRSMNCYNHLQICYNHLCHFLFI